MSWSIDLNTNGISYNFYFNHFKIKIVNNWFAVLILNLVPAQWRRPSTWSFLEGLSRGTGGRSPQMLLPANEWSVGRQQRSSVQHRLAGLLQTQYNLGKKIPWSPSSQSHVHGVVAWKHLQSTCDPEDGFIAKGLGFGAVSNQDGVQVSRL